MLPSGTEPLVLNDGTVINPENGSVIREEHKVFTEVPNNEQIQREIVTARIRIADLPVPSQQMNTISVIMCYSLYGVSDNDIATLLSITEDQIFSIKTSDAYLGIQNSFIENIVQSDQSEVRDIFVEQSKNAATKMVSLMESNSEAMQYTASKDILDRSGQRPADVVEHRHRVEGGLTIEYVEKTNSIPIIDVTPNG